MNDIDFERAVVLMDAMAKQVTVSPMMTAIFGEASEELKEINRLAKENADERAQKVREEEQIAQQQKLEAQQADQEENERQQPVVSKPVPPSIMPGQPTTILDDGEPSLTDKDGDGIEDSMQTPPPAKPTIPLSQRKI